MKATTFALVAALTGFAATTAHADSRLSIGIGINTVPVYRPSVSGYYAPAPIYVAPAGHWENVTTKTWVPARWIETRNAWGHRIRVIEPAHFAYVTNRVWVEDRRGEYRGGSYGYHGYDRHDNDHDRDDRRGDDWRYGYGRR